ncbi:DUF4190 domain-containing protein [Fibrella sp. USSR17]
MTPKSLRLFTCLLTGYLLTACQARQYGFFQASNAVILPTEQQGRATGQFTQEPASEVTLAVADTVAVTTKQEATIADKAADTPVITGRSASRDQSVGKAEQKARRKLIRSELRAAIGQYKAKPAESQTNGLATASFITGLLALVLLFTSSSIAGITLLLGPLALILGIVSLGQIKRKGQKGLGLGIAGTVLGAVYILLLLLVIAALSNFR